MVVDRVMPCYCSKDTYDSSVSSYDGMPQLKVTDVYRGKMFFEAYCPKCGRGGLFQFRSAYLALKHWNEMQRKLLTIDIWEVDDD